jgi:AcrR family transcriptional regulator
MGTLLATSPVTSASTGASASSEDRVRAAALACVARFGSTKTTLDDVARESGMSRATVYRLFPGGRETLFDAVVSAEIQRFSAILATELERHDDLEDLVGAALGTSMRFLLEHEALTTVIALEPGLLLPQLAFHRLDGVLGPSTAFVAPYLEPHLGSRRRAVSATEHLVRVVLSYTLHPSERLDPHDDESIRSFVRHHVLPGVRPPAATTT